MSDIRNVPATGADSGRRSRRPWAAAAVAGALVALLSGASAVTANSAGGGPAADGQSPAVRACDVPRPGEAACLAEVLPGSAPGSRTQAPAGYGPADLRSAYGLTAAVRAGAGKGRTVAIVDAFDAPTVEADLAVYRSTYGLPPCTTDNGCFRKVNQRGDTAPLPQPDAGWGVEISLDVQAVSALCPSCDILLVESDNANWDSLADGVDTAVRLGATTVSNSYGGPESDVTDNRSHGTGPDPVRAASYNHPGVPIVAAAGDAGFQLDALYPATLSTVTAVGGTTLKKSDTARGWSETAWATNYKGGAAGAGCSAHVAKPAWQHDRDCPNRTLTDISAVADPVTGLAVYDSIRDPNGPPAGWMKVGGTSASAPLVAAMYALAGHTEDVRDASRLYAHRDRLNDISGGSVSVPHSGQECPASSYLCTALRGYDGPTGLGTPDGLGAFAPVH
ncbi:S8 family serine peptidase [Streptomyces andamanensis]|uniref:S8 family serine peptidase n=1 Tax=Streptomyces andamanensis TaxID=1565035 RepID=A0ABV8TJL0_9ACTN